MKGFIKKIAVLTATLGFINACSHVETNALDMGLSQSKSVEAIETGTNLRLGYFLASLVTVDNQTIIEPQSFEPYIRYSNWDCRHPMRDFINQHRQLGHKVLWGKHESFILVRAFSPMKVEKKNSFEVKHFALWHEKDLRFQQIPQSFIKGRCTFFNQPFLAAVF